MQTENLNKRFEGVTDSVLDLIGNTPLLALDRLWTGPGRLLAKCEFLNPTHSLKDRSALYMIQKAKELGYVKDGQGFIEFTSGNQGTGLAMVANVLKHPFTAIMSKGNSDQRKIMMKGLGAELLLVDQVNGKPGSVTSEDKAAMRAFGLDYAAKNPDKYLCNQFENELNVLSHYETTGPEIYKQTNGKIDAFCMTVGTAGCFMGVSKYLKEKNPNIKAFCVEPEGCQPIKGLEITKPLHLLQGSGYGAVPFHFKHEYLDEALAVSEEDVLEIKKKLGKEEGLFLGYTAAANVAASLNLLKSGKLGDNPTVVTILCDTAMIANQIDQQERETMAEGGTNSEEYRKFINNPSRNMDDTGFFSIQVITKALKVWNLDLIVYNSKHEIALDANLDPTDEVLSKITVEQKIKPQLIGKEQKNKNISKLASTEEDSLNLAIQQSLLQSNEDSDRHLKTAISLSMQEACTSNIAKTSSINSLENLTEEQLLEKAIKMSMEQ
ncbi:hypothetical protein RND71_043364 [Anisodus tanguticus]|uniref:ubiquitinyl hydrolase 1 n=1 Tax=Anisodus tanguticus TaxID=243964 RepID=A0AAE1QP24_9SOLA|nr:hypothetical protein RND71_043364 [Anisodus tanguticus]